MACSMSSTNYMMTKFVTSNDSCNQLSSWSSYVEDFIANNNYGMEEEDDDDSFVYDSGFESSSSMISEGDWSAAPKPDQSFVDQDLEDTASSPAHSPKINDFSSLFMMSKKMETNVSCQEKEKTLEKTEDIIDKGLLETELRRKGLCLVPLSMLVNYCNNL